MSLDDRSGSMTSSTYTTHMFVFMFLNAMDLSKEACFDHLDVAKWGQNLTDTFFLKITKDPKDMLNCTLEAECLKGKDAACDLLGDCYSKHVDKESPECKEESLQEIYFYHFMCLIDKAFNLSSKACEYDTMCRMYPQIASTHFDLTTPPPPPTTTTILRETTATLLSSSTTAPRATFEPTTTLSETTILTVLHLSPTKVAKIATATSLPEGQGEAKRNQDKQSTPPKDTTANTLTFLLGLSLVINVILPLVVYLYVRRQWMRDKMQWTSTHSETETKTKANTHLDNSIRTSGNAEEHTVLFSSRRLLLKGQN